MRKPRLLGLALGVVAGGLALGTVLGAAADPKMKNLPGSDWQPPTAPASNAYAGVAVGELTIYPDRYAPPLPDEAITDWAPAYPEWANSDFSEDLGDDPPELFPGPEPARPAPGEPLPPEPRLAGSLDAIY